MRSKIITLLLGMAVLASIGCSRPPVSKNPPKPDDPSTKIKKPVTTNKTTPTLNPPKRTSPQAINASTEAQIIKKMCTRYQASRSLVIDVDVHQEVMRETGISKYDTKYKIIFERPNKLRLTATGRSNLSIFSDGKKATFYMPNSRQYEKHDALPNFDFNNTEPENLRFTMRLQQTNIAALFSPHPYKSYMQGITSIRTTMTDKINDTIQIELNAQNRSVVLKIKNPTTEPKLLTTTLKSIHRGKLVMQVVANSKIIESNQKQSSKTFAFVPPRGALFKSELGLNNRYAPLYGKAAPNFDIKIFKGGRLRLNQFKNKVLVISFWSGVNNIASSDIENLFQLIKPLEQHDVFFLGVNTTEDEATLEQWLEDINISPRLAQDADGRIRELFQVTRVPITLIIGHSGVIEAGHLTHTPRELAKIKDEIEQLMQGESLLAK